MNAFFRNLPIGAKVALAPAIAIVCLLLVAVTAHLTNRATREAVDALHHESMPELARTAELKLRLARLDALVMRSLAFEGSGMKAKRIKAVDYQIAAELKALPAYVTELKSKAKGEDLAFLTEAEKWLQQFAKHAAEAINLKSGGLSQSAMVMTSSEVEFLNLSKALDQLAAASSQHADERAEAASRAMRRADVASFTLLGLAVLISVCATVLCVRLITRPLSHAAHIASEVAAGNLQHRVTETSRDATGQVLQALGGVTEKLTVMVGDIRQAAEHINGASGEIASGNRDLSLRTEQTASALQQTASIVDQLSAQMQANSEGAAKANQLASEAATVARQGGTVVQDVVSTMAQISSQSQRIRDIIGTIDGIAFQTNILSLNAAVEAARAGEQGRGFAVVAQEVRALASRSSDAAKEIRSLISASVEQTQAGAERVQAAGEIMTRIVASVEQVSQMVAEIARANDEQARGVAGVNEAVGTMDQSTQQNAALVEQATAATDALRMQAEALVRALSVFRTA